jgi:glutamate racemase
MEPAVKPALELERQGRIIMAATPITVRGEKLAQLLARYDKNSLTDSIPLASLVRFSEREEFDSEAVKNYLREELSVFELDKYCALVLGCTHFNYFKDSFRDILPDNVALVDGIEGTVRRLLSRLGIAPVESCEVQKARVHFFESGEPVTSNEGIARFERLLARLEKMECIK